MRRKKEVEYLKETLKKVREREFNKAVAITQEGKYISKLHVYTCTCMVFCNTFTSKKADPKVCHLLVCLRKPTLASVEERT